MADEQSKYLQDKMEFKICTGRQKVSEKKTFSL